MKLYYSPVSPNSRKARIVAALVGVELELEHVDLFRGEQRKPEYLRKNPNGKVPTLEDGDFLLWESNAIMQYLCDIQRIGTRLYPSEPQARAHVAQWLFWNVAHYNGAIDPFVSENIFKKATGGGAPDAEVLRAATPALERTLGILNNHLEGRIWLVGADMTIADVALAVPLAYAEQAQIPLDPYRQVRRWLEGIESLDVWAKTAAPQFR